MISFFLLATALTNCQVQAEQLSTRQKEFLHDFLGLNKSELRKDFEIVADADLANKYLGFHSDQQPNKIRLNLDEMKAHPEWQAFLQEGTIVHEAIHVFLNRRHPNEEKWIQEGIATLGEFLYDLKNFNKADVFASFMPIVRVFEQKDSSDLSAFNDSPEDYGKVFLFFLFIHSNYGGYKIFQNYYTKLKNQAGLDDFMNGIRTHLPSLSSEDWQTPDAVRTQFFKSLVSRQNTLATEVNNLFSQILLQLPMVPKQ